MIWNSLKVYEPINTGCPAPTLWTAGSSLALLASIIRKPLLKMLHASHLVILPFVVVLYVPVVWAWIQVGERLGGNDQGRH